MLLSLNNKCLFCFDGGVFSVFVVILFLFVVVVAVVLQCAV